MLVYPYGVTPNDDNLIESRCYQTKAKIGTAPTKVFYAENSFGNIYYNLISAKG